MSKPRSNQESCPIASKNIPIDKAIEIINNQSANITGRYAKSDLMLISPNELSHLLFRIKSAIEDWEFY